MTRTVDVPVDVERLHAQVKHLSWLRRLPPRRLKKFHREVFSTKGRAAKYYQKLPDWTPRYYLERRCWFWFCACNYHLPHPYKENFWREADAVLREKVSDDTRAADMRIVAELRDFRRFTAEGVAALPEHRIDTYLLRLGYCVQHLPLDHKRRILFELYNLNQHDIVPRFSLVTGKPIRYMTTAISCRKAILAHPTYSYEEICQKYPEVKWDRAYFYQKRYDLRQKGYVIPKLEGGKIKERGVFDNGELITKEQWMEKYATSAGRLARESSLGVPAEQPDHKEEASDR